MKEGYTHITLVLDRSGSMGSVRDATIEGVNGFLEEQRKLPGKATFSLIQFDNQYEIHSSFEDIKDARPLNQHSYIPRGGTALLDAMGRAIHELGLQLSAMKDEDRPERVLFVVQTDGYENASTQYRNEQIREMVRHQQDKYNWEFIFLGANQDAFTTAAGFGIGAGMTLNYNSTERGSGAVYGAMNAAVRRVRTGETKTKGDLFTDLERATTEETK